MLTDPIWRPCTQMRDHEDFPVIEIVRGEGALLFDKAGNSYIDAVSSWWTCLFGHNEPCIREAVKAQLDRLEHVLFAGFTHPPAEALVHKLLPLVEPSLTRVFFADNGSSAVEVAMKLAHGFFVNRGRPEKKRFVHLSHGYHGETLGALSLCGEPLYKRMFEAIMVETIMVEGPDCLRCPYGLDRESCDAECFEPMRRTLETLGPEIAAVFIEPMIQCAGGFRMYSPSYLRKLRAATLETDVLLVLDEIAVGFGRTGRLWGGDHAGVAGDLVCLSKGLTGGFLPLSLVLTTDAVYAAFYADYAAGKAFLHSHSYTGNPLGCAAASAVLDLVAQEDVPASNAPKARLLADLVRERFARTPHVAEVRTLGFVTAVEFVADVKTLTPFDPAKRLGLHLYRRALGRGALLRNLGDLLYFMPPYRITESQIRTLVDAAADAARAVLG